MAINLQLQQIYQDEFLNVAVDEKLRFIYVEWLQHPDSPDFRRLFQMLADLTLAARSRYWLSDARAIHYIEFADQNWLVREMAPLLIKSNLVKFARLTTQESFEMVDVIRVYNQIEQLTELGIKTKLELFTSKDEALMWLFSDFDKDQESIQEE